MFSTIFLFTFRFFSSVLSIWIHFICNTNGSYSVRRRKKYCGVLLLLGVSLVGWVYWVWGISKMGWWIFPFSITTHLMSRQSLAAWCSHFRGRIEKNGFSLSSMCRNIIKYTNSRLAIFNSKWTNFVVCYRQILEEVHRFSRCGERDISRGRMEQSKFFVGQIGLHKWTMERVSQPFRYHPTPHPLPPVAFSLSPMSHFVVA